MKRTLLEMVQSILSDMDSEPVNSIGDTIEAMQIASVIEDTFYNITVAREIPEHKKLLKMTSLSDTTRPTYFRYPNSTKEIEKLFYNVSTDGGANFREIRYVDPLTFLSRMPTQTQGNTVSADIPSGTQLVFVNNKMPSYYTSFDDNLVILDSFDSSVETILQESKTRAYGTVYPSFSISDDFVPEVDDTMLPYLLAEAKSTCFSLFKSGSDPKVEQAARRLKSFVQNDMYKTKMPFKRPHYGRH